MTRGENNWRGKNNKFVNTDGKQQNVFELNNATGRENGEHGLKPEETPSGDITFDSAPIRSGSI